MELGLQLARTFADGRAYLKAYIGHLQKIYELRHFVFEDADVDEFQFRYCQRMHGFLVVLPYSNETAVPSVFLTWTFSSRRLAWDGASAGLGQSYTEVRANVELIFRRFLPRVTMLTATPVASVENRFTFGTQTVSHFGLVYACAAANVGSIQEENPDLRGLFLPIKAVLDVNLADSWNRDLILHACEQIPKLTRGARSVEREIAEQKEQAPRYRVHRNITKPLLRLADPILAQLLRRERTARIRDLAFEAVPADCSTLLDVSAGDHRGALEFGRKAKVVVLNDVAWDTLGVLSSDEMLHEFPDTDFVFVNEDILTAPFRARAFDVVFCRNTLHHFSMVDEVVTVLQRMRDWAARRVVVMDVLDPREEARTWDVWRDAYYRRFLHDVGDAFLRLAEFRKLLAQIFPSKEWNGDLTVHDTVGGRLALWVATRKSPHS